MEIKTFYMFNVYVDSNYSKPYKINCGLECNAGYKTASEIILYIMFIRHHHDVVDSDPSQLCHI